ncbi:response regulator transcription factor [Planctomonas deserti]|uniref:response regulator transcription factor n=1 Tax=Planctomonas deserti TaxID=2144185 RepID=UPI000D3834E2|nr:response regulator transcription factor [Planctomonas deserti]
MSDTVRVLVVDDQDLVRAGFRIILESGGGIEVVGEAADGLRAVELTRELRPDVVCMDVQMPRMDGLEATRIIAADPESASRVLMLTTFDNEDYLFSALRAGASGFLLKNSSPEKLIEAVLVVAQGNALLSPDVTRRVIERFGPGSSVGAAPAVPTAGGLGSAPAAGSASSSGVGAGSSGSGVGSGPSGSAPSGAPTGAGTPDRLPEQVACLTDRELEVLRLLAEGLTNAEIASRLYLGDATVKTHVSKLLLKLGVRDRVQAVVFAYEHGVVVPGADPA